MLRILIRQSAILSAIGAAAVLSGCGMFQGYDGLRAPNYASPIGTDNWEVNCGRSRIIVDDDALEDFYREDGSLMTYTEFCQTAEPSNIRRNRQR